jgi:hypothetical protein
MFPRLKKIFNMRNWRGIQSMEEPFQNIKLQNKNVFSPPEVPNPTTFN